MAPGASKTGDDRFAALSNDPRYRIPNSKHGRVTVDKRFSRMFSERGSEFTRQPQVDKYGRRIAPSSQKEREVLKGLYKADDEDGSENEEVDLEEEKLARAKRRDGDTGRAGKVSGDSISDESGDEDGEVRAELRRMDKKYDPARDGGFESSSDEDSSGEDEEVEAELPEEDQAQVPMGEVSRRLAVVNLDWDNIRAMDIMAVAASFVPADGRIESVKIYPSEFGKERLEREELEGPPKEIFAASKSGQPARRESDGEEYEDEEDDERIKKQLLKGDGGEEFDSAALRRYQLDRLRYFYAVISCSNEATAESIYKALDGREYLSSANFFDLRFIPGDVEFEDDEPRDQCDSLTSGYKPNEFVTEALTHSKVKLTWDADDATRKEVQKRAFSRSEMDENDLKAYIGGDSDSDELDAGEDAQAPKESTTSKKEAERKRLRELLGLAERTKEKPRKDEQKPVGDLQITFTSGLGGGGGGREGRDGVFENSPPRDETTRERYVRKERERKARRKERARARRNAGSEGGGEAGGGALQDTSGSESGSEIVIVDNGRGRNADKEDPFDDPFFNDLRAENKPKKERLRKEDRIKKREAKEKQMAEEEAQRRELESIMEDGNEDKMKHFDMKEIQKAAKKRGKKDKKGRKGGEVDGRPSDATVENGDDDTVDTADPRFAKLFESHEYAIDPTNPRFQKTEGMQKLLEEGRKRRRPGGEGGGDGAQKRTKPSDDGESDTRKLLARVKTKSAKALR